MKNNSKWKEVSDSECVEIASKCQSRQEWKTRFPQWYAQVHVNRRHLISACTLHMGFPKGPLGSGYQIYVYSSEDLWVYVGITCFPSIRHKNHLMKGPVKEKSAELGYVPILSVVGSNLDRDSASFNEVQLISFYRSLGFNVSNKSNGGQFGSMRHKYSIRECINTARQYSNRTSFYLKNKQMAQMVYARNWMDSIAAELGWPVNARKRWTAEKADSIAQTYATPSEWLDNHPDSYYAAYRNGWLGSILTNRFERLKSSRWMRH